MKRVLLALMLILAWGALLYFSNPLDAVAPTKPRKIPDDAFRPVHTPTVVRDTSGLYNRATLPPQPELKKVPDPIIIDLTEPTPMPHNVGTGQTVADAKAYALSRLGSEQYSCLDKIAIHESHWNPFDLNPTSGAYGIPQALPGSKMASAGADWETNPVTQIKWMIHYVNVRYGSACAAWGFWINNSWY